MENNPIKLPKHYRSIQKASAEIAFSMPSDLQTGSLLRTLVASKPKGHFLELGTGTGLSLAWIMEAIDNQSVVISIDNSETYLAIAQAHFGKDSRLALICQDANIWIQNNAHQRFDLIFADTWAGKYEQLEATLALLKTGGFYIIDDMRPQPNWPEGHELKAENLINHLHTRKDICLTILNWSTGIIIVTKI
jgi:predicted O-methyltransferase YrrM